MDSRDWDYKDADLDYKSVMEGDLSDGSIILMHDIHPVSYTHLVWHGALSR